MNPFIMKVDHGDADILDLLCSRPGGVIRMNAVPTFLPEPPRKLDCRNCGAPVSRYECRCSYCKSEQ